MRYCYYTIAFPNERKHICFKKKIVNMSVIYMINHCHTLHKTDAFRKILFLLYKDTGVCLQQGKTFYFYMIVFSGKYVNIKHT